MYSMVLMVAMTAPATEAPGWGWRTGCCGGYSCYGSCVGWGWGAGCHGCWGGHWAASCHGCGGCWGYPVAYYGFAGCYGSCYGSYTNYFSYWSTPPNVHYGWGMPMQPMPPAAAPANPMPGAPAKAPDPMKKVGLEPAPATVVVNLPANTPLYANGYRTGQTSAERRFTTPPLRPGELYYYEFSAAVEHNGKSVTETKRVEVSAGATVRVEFGPRADAARVAAK